MLLKKSRITLFKKLTLGKLSLSGINSFGRKTLYHRGAGVKRNFRVIDFNKYVANVPALVLTFEYDPNRTSPISLLSYCNSSIAYSLSVNNTNAGSIVSTFVLKNPKDVIKEGDSSFLNIMKPGVYINSIQVSPNKNLKYVRSGGNFAKLVSVVLNQYAIIKLKSKVLLKLNVFNIATLGVLFPPFRTILKRAGVNRRLGRRPHVRGVAMNPIDHPHGGGQGKTSGGRPSVTPWALITKGRKTKKKIKYAKTVVKR